MDSTACQWIDVIDYNEGTAVGLTWLFLNQDMKSSWTKEWA